MRTISGLTAFAATALFASPALAAPDLSSCPQGEGAAEELGVETEPVTLDPALASVAVTDGEQMAIETLAGDTICSNVQGLFSLDNPAFVMTERFFGTEWTAMEAFGYMLFDRAGKGSEVETGQAPVFSDGMHRMASIQFSGAGFGGLEGFVVWTVTEKGLKKLYELSSESNDIAMAYTYVDLKLDGFVGQSCVRISGVASGEYTRVANEGGDLRFAKRTEFFAREDKDWVITQGLSTGCLDN
ncbi:MAG: hypothetical protein AAF687_08965 [Pseudomonadota bacterium]